jgi:hypothetical protein
MLFFQLLKSASRATWVLYGVSIMMLAGSLWLLLHTDKFEPKPPAPVDAPLALKGPLAGLVTPFLSDPPGASPTSSPQATPAPKPKTPPPTPQLTPHSFLGLTNWRLALPVNTAHAGEPDQIDQPELAGFSLNPYFYLTENKSGVVFRAHASGATTKNSNYPRSELREMTNNGTQAAAWSNKTGVHTMTVRQAITHTPVVKPHVVAGQIHDDDDDVVMIRLEGSRLFVQGDGDDLGLLDENYNLGTVFTIKIVASGGHIVIYYNDVLKVDYAKSKSGLYFKAGCYTQSNTDRGDDAEAYGEVVIYSLKVEHT